MLHSQLQPYVPSAADPFERVKAGHLLNRAGFGGLPQEIEAVLRLGPAKAADWLLDFPDARAEHQHRGELDGPDLSSITGYPTSFGGLIGLFANKTEAEKKILFLQLLAANAEALRQTGVWWMRRMTHGPFPLQEKLTLFWHGHFTTSARDELAARLMWEQNETLRHHAAGNFKAFVKAIARDPAMIDYLNNQQNIHLHPNENFARELMELFTLGIGNYTERDVKEAARAFTGWGHDYEHFVYRNYFHDAGPKTLLGRTGPFDGDDVIEILFQQPALGTFIAGKLLRYFASEDADDAIAASLGGVFKESKWELRPVLRTLFTSKLFYSPRAIGAQIKSPVQLVVGSVRLLGAEMPWVGDTAGFAAKLEQMGQVPLFPPNVKGWPGGRAWINTSTLFARYNTVAALVTPQVAEQAGPPRRRGGSTSAGEAVDYWVARLIQRPIDPGQRRTLLDALAGRPDDPAAAQQLVKLIVSMPEYQVC